MKLVRGAMVVRQGFRHIRLSAVVTGASQARHKSGFSFNGRVAERRELSGIGACKVTVRLGLINFVVLVQ